MKKGCCQVTEIKIAGAALILVSAAAIGWVFGERAKREIKVLLSLNRCLMLFESEIRYSMSTIKDICVRLSEADELWSDFFGLVAEGISADSLNADAGSVWEKAVEKSDISETLDDEDKAWLIRFGSELGNSDRESELGKINMYIDYTKNRLLCLEKNINERVRLCRLLGVTAGVFITILIV